MRRLMIRALLMVAALALLGSVTPAGASAATTDRFRLVTAANSPFGKGANGCCTLLSDANGKYASAELGYRGRDYGMLRARADVADAWERFALTGTDTTWTVKSEGNGKYVSAELGYSGNGYGMLRARADVADAWEKFDLYYNKAQNLYALKSQANGKFVSAELGYRGREYAMLRARASEIGAWEKFRLGAF
ncbi:fascin domain-containing protein [Actinomadura litoris]|uniref:fascin domain-containing protein n=1 Tax=Actinomadura litoris TaxID=2678616 RepID=UPI001FA74859|nr:hypothetical protein [Actinomadura litoris]